MRNPLALVAAIAARFGARWLPPLLAEPVAAAQKHVDAAVAALLRPASVALRQRIVERVAREGEGSGTGRGALSLALSPEPLQLAQIVGVTSSSGWRWAGYPVWLARRAFTYAQASAEARRLAGDEVKEMRAWLEQG